MELSRHAMVPEVVGKKLHNIFLFEFIEMSIGKYIYILFLLPEPEGVLRLSSSVVIDFKVEFEVSLS